MQAVETNPWNIIADQYDKDFGDQGDWLHRFIIYPSVLKLLGNIKDKKLIDIGCGTGTFTRMLSKNSKDVTGIDFAEKMIKLAQNRSSVNRIKYSVLDITNGMETLDKDYDTALFIMVLHSINNGVKALTNASKIIKSNGNIIIVAPHPFFLNYFRSLQNYDPSKYLTPQTAKFTWKQFTDNCYAPTEFYIRSLQDYSNIISKSGLIISDIIEPEIVDEAEEFVTPLTTERIFKRMKEIPSFIIFNCTKK
jgi:ubiquinone/menaquinone biosynthesis C-methylase UbiE